jgi:hypothetical protein
MAVSQNEQYEPTGRPIGSWRGTRIEVIAGHVAHMPCALAIAGMFIREPEGTELGGGLRHLDEALGGAICRMRSDGIFNGRIGETMVLSAPPPPIRANSILIIGLGEPGDWLPDVMNPVVALAARRAMQLAASSVAFASGVLDGGLPVNFAMGSEMAMMAMMAGLRNELESNAARPPERWVFCAPSRRFNVAVRDFALAFDELAPPC